MFSYRLVDSSEEVNLILQRVHLGFQLNLVHVGAIYILQYKKDKEPVGIGDWSEEMAINHSATFNNMEEFKSHLLEENKLILHAGTLVNFIFISDKKNSAKR